jgi:hypothetical protein
MLLKVELQYYCCADDDRSSLVDRAAMTSTAAVFESMS